MSDATSWVSGVLFGPHPQRLGERDRDQYLQALRDVSAERFCLDAREHRLIEGARNLGATWRQVADVLGLDSPQAAQRRQGKLAGLITDLRSRGAAGPAVREVRLNGKKAAGRVALVDAEDYDLVSGYNWHIFYNNGYGPYASGQPKGAGTQAKQINMHNLIMGRMLIDHKNHNGLDNRRSNLRVATRAQNARNVRKQPGSRFRFKGVRLHGRKWIARITVDGNRIDLGGFSTEEEAARAYDAAAREAHGEFACVNFPEVCG